MQCCHLVACMATLSGVGSSLQAAASADLSLGVNASDPSDLRLLPGGEVNAACFGMTEIQILDDGYGGIDPRQVHGSAYGMVGAVGGYQRPRGEWNHQLVTVEGSKLTVELNGTTVLDADVAPVTDFMDDKPHPGKDRTSGFFGFCGHADAVEFRAIRIKKLP